MSNARSTERVTSSLKEGDPFFIIDGSLFNKLRILPSPSASNKSIPYSRLVNLSSSPKNAPRLIVYSCSRLGVFNTSINFSPADSTVSTAPP